MNSLQADILLDIYFLEKTLEVTTLDEEKEILKEKINEAEKLYVEANKKIKNT